MFIEEMGHGSLQEIKFHLMICIKMRHKVSLNRFEVVPKIPCLVANTIRPSTVFDTDLVAPLLNDFIDDLDYLWIIGIIEDINM
jgi:hypothetical protein